MPGPAKTKPATPAEKPAPVSDLSKQENSGAVSKGKYTDSPAEIEIGGRKGLEPTRFGDWEKNGRCTDF